MRNEKEKSCEQCTSLQGLVEDSLPTLSSDIPLWLRWSGNPTPAKYCGNGLQTDGSLTCTCGKGMSECSIHPNTPEKWIASMQDSLAKTLVSLENKRVLAKEPGQGFTVKSCELLAVLDQDTSSWKMWPLLSAKVLKKYSKTWPRWGMTQGGYAYAHPMSERRITVTGGGYWPTPDTRGFVNKGSLQMLVKMCDSEAEYMKMGYRAAQKTKAKYWPTPTAHNAKECNAKSESQRNTPTLAAQVGGILNPNWVGWLMGFPIGWANSKATATRKSRSKPQQLSKSSTVDDLPEWLK